MKININRVPDSVRRGIRTFIQSFIGVFIATISTPEFVSVHGLPHLSTLESAALAAVWGAGIAVLSFGQNLLEDRNVIPAMLKAPASDGADPIPKA